MALRFSVDTNIFLNVKNKEEPYYRYSKKMLERIDDGETEGVVSTMVVAELCAGSEPLPIFAFPTPSSSRPR